MNYYEAVVQGKIDPELLPTIPEGVHLEILQNQFTLILKPEQGKEVLSALLFCETGSATEGKWLGSGISHLVEHMLFKGTKKRQVGQIEEDIQSWGGNINAYTTYELTCISVDIPTEGWLVAIDVLHDLSCQASFPEDELYKEMDVIRREMDMEQDEPDSWSYRRLKELVYRYSPYRYPIIGYKELFNRLSRNDLVQYYQERFVPNLMTLVLVGDFPLEEVLNEIYQRWGSIPMGKSLPWELAQDPQPVSQLSWEEIGPFELAWLHYAWRTPRREEYEALVLEITSTLLGGSSSSRLYKRLRLQRGIAHSLSCWISDIKSERLLGISLACHPQHLQEVEQIIEEELHNLYSTPPPEDELRKLINLYLNGCLQRLETTEGRAFTIGHDWLNARDLLFTARLLGRALRIKPEDVSEVVKKYLNRKTRFRYLLLPKTSSHRSVSKPQVTQQPVIERFNPFEQMRVLVRADHSLPLVYFKMSWIGGTIFEEPALNGITSIFSRLWIRGTKHFSDQQILETIERLGGSINASTNYNTFSLSCSVLSSNWNEAFNIIKEIILEPTFPEEILQQEKKLRIEAIKAKKDDPLSYSVERALNHLFGNCGFGLSALGTEQSISNLTREDLLRFHTTRVIPEHAVIAAFGAIETEKILEQIYTLKTGKVWQPPMAPVSCYSPQTQIIYEPIEKTQVIVVIAFKGTTVYSEDRYGLSLVISACQGLGSRIFRAIREELGLSYYASATTQFGLVPGYIIFYLGTSPDNLQKAYTKLLLEIRNLSYNGLSEAEIERTKRKIAGHKKLALQSQPALATTATTLELYGFGYEAIEKELQRLLEVRQEEILGVVQRYLDLRNALVYVSGPLEIESIVKCLPKPQEIC